MDTSRAATQPAPPIQDLLRDKMLLDAPRVPYNGADVPALGGIPLLYELGRGGMGAVYYGLHPRLNQEVAVKVLSFSADDADPGSIERFRREAELGARVRSDHLVGVLDVNEDSGLHFIVMEFVEGSSAQELLRQLKKAGAKGLPEADALSAIAAACEGLAAAHEKDVVHRDVKPGNILIPRGKKDSALQFHRTKLADLGLAYCGSLDFRMTRTGAVMGTPGFMAPEQVDDSKACLPSADVFSMGVTLYALLTGSAPFAGKGLRATAEVQHKPIRDLRANVSAATAELIDRCMQKDPSRRYANGAELLAALNECLHPSSALPVSTLKAESPAASALPMAELTAAVAADAAKTAKPDVPTERISARAPEPIPEELSDEKVLAEIPPPVASREMPSSTVQPSTMPATAAIEIPTVIEWASSIDLWKSLTLDLGRGESLAMMLIPAGRFHIGSPESEAGRGMNEKQHEVEITRPFYMGKFAVTQVQFAAVMGRHRSYFKGPKNPVENVSWQDATIFCDLLGERTGKKIQLPTEAQWEFACRAGTTTPFHCGATLHSRDANYNGTYTYGKGIECEFRRKTLPVGSFKPNAFDLYDMHGNVYEWCRDAYVQQYEKLSPFDPFNPHGAARVVRGGSWYDFPANCRSAFRSSYSDAYPYVGFRVVADARQA